MRETQPIHDEYKQIRWKGKQESLPKHTAPISQYGMQLTAICGQICRT